MGDDQWKIAGAACVLTGTFLAIVSGKNRWFAMGGILGAVIIGYRYHQRLHEGGCNGTTTDRKRASARYLRHVLREKPDFDRLGAPEIPAVETPAIGGLGEPQTREGVEGYPMMFRVPDCEVHIDTMDDRIRPHFTGPLGPENDPVRYW